MQDVITDEAEAEAGRLSYDAHGKRRQTDWQPSGGLIVPLETPRGFTGHEHLDNLGLIHMNGRVYDPVLGKFLSADPIVQFPETTQGFNRYTYAANNPLSFTDPSGFFIKKLFKKIVKWIKKNIRSIVGIALAAIPVVGPIVAAVYTGILAVSNGGNLGDALMAAAISYGTAMAFQGVGDFFGKLGETTAFGLKAVRFAAKTFAHGMIGGVSSVLRGGKLAAGFLSGAFANLASPVIEWMPGPIAQTVASAVAGGAGAKLGGGKFANGAITGAFARLFGELAADGELEAAETVDLKPGDVQLAMDPWAMDNDPFTCSLVSGGDFGGIGGCIGGGGGAARGGVYRLRDPISGKVERTGRTNNLHRRKLEHGRDPATKDLVFESVFRTDSYRAQRGLEQVLYDRYLGARLNFYRPISLRNTNIQKYLDAAHGFPGGG